MFVCCRFNLLFLKRFWLIMTVAVPRVFSKSLLLLVILIVARAAGQLGLRRGSVRYTPAISSSVSVFSL